MTVRREAALAVLLFIAACGKDDGAVLARVDGSAVTEADFRRELDARPFASQEYLETLPGRKEMLELLVRRRVMLAEAGRADFDRRPDVRQKLADVDEAYRRQRDEARERVLVGEFLRHLQEGDLKVSDQEVRDFWSNEREVRAAHILLGDEAKAREALARLQKGAKFEALAKELSEDAATGRKGGDLGWLMRGMLVPEFEKALFDLKPGEVSGVAPSPFGFHIVRKTEERALSAGDFEKSAPKVRAVLEKRKFQAWIEGAKARHKISTDAATLQALAAKTQPQPPKEKP